MLIGEFKGNEDFHVVQYRLEKDSRTTTLLPSNYHLKGQTVLTLILEDKATGEMIYFQDAVQEEIFNSLFKVSQEYVYQSGMTEREIAQTVMRLSNMNNFTSSGPQDSSKSQQIEFEGSANSFNEVGSNMVSNHSTVSVDYHELKDLLSDVKEHGTVDLKDYSVPESIFKESGWKKYSVLIPIRASSIMLIVLSKHGIL